MEGSAANAYAIARRRAGFFPTAFNAMVESGLRILPPERTNVQWLIDSCTQSYTLQLTNQCIAS